MVSKVYEEKHLTEPINLQAQHLYLTFRYYLHPYMTVNTPLPNNPNPHHAYIPNIPFTQSIESHPYIHHNLMSHHIITITHIHIHNHPTNQTPQSTDIISHSPSHFSFPILSYPIYSPISPHIFTPSQPILFTPASTFEPGKNAPPCH
jgi:hypothetical protein